MKLVKEIMTLNPVTCTQETSLQEAARLMVEYDCGEIPVIKSDSKMPEGVITDRDICCRTVAQGKNPLNMKVRQCMSAPCITVPEQMGIDECASFMEASQVRRMLVANELGELTGIVALADLALNATTEASFRTLKEVSLPSDASSQAPGY